jgi:hypothetical protein
LFINLRLGKKMLIEKAQNEAADMEIQELLACFLSFLKNAGLILCSEIIT